MRPHIQDVALIEKIFRYSFYKIEMEQTLFHKAFSVFSSIKKLPFQSSGYIKRSISHFYMHYFAILSPVCLPSKNITGPPIVLELFFYNNICRRRRRFWSTSAPSCWRSFWVSTNMQNGHLQSIANPFCCCCCWPLGYLRTRYVISSQKGVRKYLG